jgi:hypothetical protein
MTALTTNRNKDCFALNKVRGFIRENSFPLNLIDNSIDGTYYLFLHILCAFNLKLSHSPGESNLINREFFNL